MAASYVLLFLLNLVAAPDDVNGGGTIALSFFFFLKMKVCSKWIFEKLQ